MENREEKGTDKKWKTEKKREQTRNGKQRRKWNRQEMGNREEKGTDKKWKTEKKREQTRNGKQRRKMKVKNEGKNDYPLSKICE
jgi:hypothetical protein